MRRLPRRRAKLAAMLRRLRAAAELALVLIVVVLVALGLGGCSDGQLPAYGEALVVVDTDLPIGRIASRLRVDLFDEHGSWFSSRDIVRPDPRDWPLSFSVYSADEQRSKQVWLRLRLYPEGRVRDYLGERFWSWGTPFDELVVGNGPRLLSAGQDLTPLTEPQPLVTVDRLLLVSLRPGERGRLLVSLPGACAGTMALLSDQEPTSGPVLGRAQSCVDTSKQRIVVSASALQKDNMQTPSEPLQARTAWRGCSALGLADRICAPGGATVLGSLELTLYPELEPVPERVVYHEPFWMDRFEVSVGRYRAAVSAGFVAPVAPLPNDGPLGTTMATTCTYSGLELGRDDYPLSCVAWSTARAFCQHAGGDLPTEAQWEHMATLAASSGRSRYVWGDEPPSCDRASYGRLPLGGTAGVCQHLGIGPQPIASYQATDVSWQGVVGAAGGVGEWMRDASEGYRSLCWSNSPLLDPHCWQDQPIYRSVRGGSWAAMLASAVRLGSGPTSPSSILGFRCAYPAEPEEKP